jgi:predicted SprT family Zn-dependent metalloprotease
MERFRAGKNPDRVAKLIVHELMHVEQWRRLGGVRHSSQYMWDYVRNRLGGAKHWDSYRAIRLELEARAVAAFVMQSREQ